MIIFNYKNFIDNQVYQSVVYCFNHDKTVEINTWQ